MGGVPTFTNNAGASNLVFDGTSVFVHGRDGGSIPVATWQEGSVVSITGLVSTAINNQVFTQNLSNLIWDNPFQPFSQNINASFTVSGTLKIKSTGNGAIVLSNTNNTRTARINDFYQTGGILNLGEVNTTLTGRGILSVYGDFVQSGGSITNSGGHSISKVLVNGNTDIDFAFNSITGCFFELNKPSGVSNLLASSTVNINFYMIDGTLNLGTNSLVFNSNLILINGEFDGTSGNLTVFNSTPTSFAGIVNQLNVVGSGGIHVIRNSLLNGGLSLVGQNLIIAAASDFLISGTLNNRNTTITNYGNLSVLGVVTLNGTNLISLTSGSTTYFNNRVSLLNSNSAFN